MDVSDLVQDHVTVDAADAEHTIRGQGLSRRGAFDDLDTSAISRGIPLIIAILRAASRANHTGQERRDQGGP
jgi:hypothetical protein